jgi:hypothetical protein
MCVTFPRVSRCTARVVGGLSGKGGTGRSARTGRIQCPFPCVAWPSHEDRERRWEEDERGDSRLVCCCGLLWLPYSSISPAAESATRIQPALLSNTTKMLRCVP